MVPLLLLLFSCLIRAAPVASAEGAKDVPAILAVVLGEFGIPLKDTLGRLQGCVEATVQSDFVEQASEAIATMALKKKNNTKEGLGRLGSALGLLVETILFKCKIPASMASHEYAAKMKVLQTAAKKLGGLSKSEAFVVKDKKLQLGGYAIHELVDRLIAAWKKDPAPTVPEEVSSWQRQIGLELAELLKKLAAIADGEKSEL